jgi:extracellular elastinolytic metalloproteinase
MFGFRRLALFTFVVGLSFAAAPAVQRAADAFPPDFDLRTAPASAPLEAARAAAAEAFAEAFGRDVEIHWGDLSTRPLLVHRPGGVLGVAVGADGVEAARRFLARGAAAFGLSAEEIDALDPAKVYDTAATGWTHVQFLQRIGGIAVHRGHVRVNLDAGGGVMNVAGEYFPGLAVNAAAPAVSAESALYTAATGIGLSGAIPETVSREAAGERRTVFAAGGEYLEPTEVRLLYLPDAEGRATLTWEVVVWEDVTGYDNQYRVLVDALTGEALFRRLLTLYMPTGPADAHGLVFDCSDPDNCVQTDESFAGDPVASPSHWLTDGQSETAGPNIVCRADFRGNNDDINNAKADGGNQLDFDFVFLDSYAGGGSFFADTDPGIVNGFYWGNVIHDHWHALGFDEAAGNYQDDNFGRGGLGGDHVNVDVQDSASISLIRNNANWNPTNDGTPARTNYFLWTDPDHDGAFDAKIYWHEFGHGLSTRLVGGPSTTCLPGAQGGGMGEGWGDWLAVNYFGVAADDPAGPVTIGEYVTHDTGNGIRRYPYAYDMGLDPLTYADLCNQGCAVHREGEIWASTLWDMRHDMIQTLGFAEGKLRSEQLVIDAMKLSPCSPNFVTMRDLILQADTSRYGGQHSCLIRTAFARRGLGAGATSNGTGDNASADFGLIQPLDSTLVFDDVDTLSWAAQGGAVTYRVARGDFTSDASSNTFDNATCQGEQAGLTFDDAAVPAVGQGFYYVVAWSDDCFGSDYGADSGGTVRTVAECP